MKKNTFTLTFDKVGNSLRLFSNGVIAVRVKINREERSYNIIDIKTGMILMNKHCLSYRNMLLHIRRDINQIFDIYKSSDDYNLVFTQKLSPKRRM